MTPEFRQLSTQNLDQTIRESWLAVRRQAPNPLRYDSLCHEYAHVAALRTLTPSLATLRYAHIEVSADASGGMLTYALEENADHGRPGAMFVQALVQLAGCVWNTVIAGGDVTRLVPITSSVDDFLKYREYASRCNVTEAQTVDHQLMLLFSIGTRLGSILDSALQLDLTTSDSGNVYQMLTPTVH